MLVVNSNMPEHSTLLTPAEAAAYLRLSPKTLANLRSSGRGPRFVKMGQIRYRHSDLLDFIERASAQSTAEAQNAKQ